MLEGITDGVYVAYIGVGINCDADPNAFTYDVDLKFQFTYQYTNGFYNTCTQYVTPTKSYNSLMRDPVINFQSTPNVTINPLGAIETSTVQISQDGIGAYLEDLDFEVFDLDLSGEIHLVGLEVNNTPIPYTYDTLTQKLDCHIPGSFFTGNTSPNPTDTLFNENERVRIKFLYRADRCPSVTQALTYKASWL